MNHTLYCAWHKGGSGCNMKSQIKSTHKVNSNTIAVGRYFKLAACWVCHFLISCLKDSRESNQLNCFSKLYHNSQSSTFYHVEGIVQVLSARLSTTIYTIINAGYIYICLGNLKLQDNGVKIRVCALHSASILLSKSYMNIIVSILYCLMYRTASKNHISK